jgi:carboxypeptidase Q
VGGGAQVPGDALNLSMYGRIRDEGHARSHVMDCATELMDGSRLTGSPNLKKAIAWARERLTQMGLSRVLAESWGEFGVCWEQRNVWARMIAPDNATFIAHAAPWSPDTGGAVAADVVSVGGLDDENNFGRYRGKLRDKIVLLARAPGRPDVVPFDKPLFTRLSDEQLAAYVHAPAGVDTDPRVQEEMWAQIARIEQVERFLPTEGVRAVIVPSWNRPNGGISGGTLMADGNAALSPSRIGRTISCRFLS